MLDLAIHISKETFGNLTTSHFCHHIYCDTNMHIHPLKNGYTDLLCFIQQKIRKANEKNSTKARIENQFQYVHKTNAITSLASPSVLRFFSFPLPSINTQKYLFLSLSHIQLPSPPRRRPPLLRSLLPFQRSGERRRVESPCFCAPAACGASCAGAPRHAERARIAGPAGGHTDVGGGGGG